MRLFVAIELPQDVRQALAVWQNVLRESIRAKVSWTRPDNLHLTLKFIGEVDDDRGCAIQLALANVKSPPIPLSITGLLRLPPRGPTRIIAALLRGQVATLFAQIESSLQSCGIDRDARECRPHITLGRVRDRVRISPEQVALPSASEMSFEAGDFVLVQSTLSPHGSRYEVLKRFMLSGAADQ
jgi:2'-5' RNA ligase